MVCKSCIGKKSSASKIIPKSNPKQCAGKGCPTPKLDALPAAKASYFTPAVDKALDQKALREAYLKDRAAMNVCHKLLGNEAFISDNLRNMSKSEGAAYLKMRKAFDKEIGAVFDEMMAGITQGGIELHEKLQSAKDDAARVKCAKEITRKQLAVYAKSTKKYEAIEKRLKKSYVTKFEVD